MARPPFEVLRTLDDQIVDCYDPALGLTLPEKIAWMVSVVRRPDDGGDGEDDAGATWLRLLTALLRDPGAPRLRTLILADWTEYALDPWDVAFEEGDPLPLMKRHAGRLAGLERLHIGAFPGELPPARGVCQGIGPALAKLPALLRLDLHGEQGWELVPKAGHPRLRTLVMHVGEAADDPLEALIAAPFPALERLDLWLGSGVAEALDEAEFAAALASERLPALRDLSLRGFEAPTLLDALVGQAPRLSSLAITHAPELGDEGLACLLTAPWLPRLRRLDLRGTGVSAERVAELAKQGPEIVGGD
ncbi:hypothetical protein [Nannocystis pusilla]|uniref:hypothetical protein n=1 Tax=Nannocystis pusilla TaxID=889268 RepID=UPI003BF3265F